MKLGVSVMPFLRAVAIFLLTAGAAPCFAQINIHIHTATGLGESHIGDLTGHSEAGKQLYRRFCIGCHGPNGDGKGENAPYLADGILPRDFTLGLFKCRSTISGSLPLDSDLFDTVGRGLVTTGMPSWGPLTDQDRADLVAFIKTFSPRFEEEKPDKPIPIPAESADTPESQRRGEELYQKTLKCFECHGKSGRGDGPSAPTLRDNKGNAIPPYDFTTGSRFKCGATNTDLYRIFMTGLDGTPMPAWSDWVSPDQGWDLVHYLRTLQVNYKAGKSKTAPPSREKSKDNTAQSR
jgi:mono/diheme cytochrome c family protein